MDSVDDTSVRVSWRAVDDADRYTATFTKTLGNNQEGPCISNAYTANVSVDAPSVSITIAVGEGLAHDDAILLRAYTTYSITVVAVSDVTGSSEDSVAIPVTTAQIGRGPKPL